MRLQFWFLVFAGIISCHLTAGFSRAQTLADPSVTNEDNFGFSVAIHDSFIIVGDPRDDLASTNVGRAHLYSTGDGVLLRSFDDPTETTQDNFGAAVGVDEQYVVVGAPQDSTQGPLVGQAYLFDANSGALSHTFDDPTSSSADFFGAAVDVDGPYVVVGAPGDDSDGFGIGQAHIFSTETGQLLHTLQDPTVTGFDSFGTSVAIEGEFVLVGDPGDDTFGFGVGAAHMFNAETGDFIRTYNDPTNTGSDEFGSSVSLSNGLVLVGAPGDDTLGSNIGQAYLFDADTGSLLQTLNAPNPSDEDDFGRSVALSGTLALVGAPNGESESGANAGQAFLFDALAGTLRQTFEQADGQAGDSTGFSVAIAGNIVTIGSPFSNADGTDSGSASRFEVSTVVKGDVNLDGTVDLLDIAPFVSVISRGDFQAEADIDCNGMADLLDVEPFVDLLTGA